MWAITRTHLTGLGAGAEEIVDTFDTEDEAVVSLDVYAAVLDAQPLLRVIEKSTNLFYVQAPSRGPEPRTCISIEEV
jgi:hypothetical protein